MSRKRESGESDDGDVINIAMLGVRDFQERYLPPSESCPRWELPDCQQIIEDFERCSSDLTIYLKAIKDDADHLVRQMILTAVLDKLSTSAESLKRFYELRAAGENARLMLLEENAMFMARHDTTALKFVLEKRKSDRFGKVDKAATVDDEKKQQVDRLIDALKRNKD